MVDRKRVLLIEDDLSISEAVVELLEMEGYYVSAAGNGIEGLDHLKTIQEKPNLILLDLMMPGMNGVQFKAEQSRLSSELSSIPVIVMSADTQIVRKAAEAKADGFLKKPIELDDLLSTLKKYCS